MYDMVNYKFFSTCAEILYLARACDLYKKYFSSIYTFALLDNTLFLDDCKIC